MIPKKCISICTRVGMRPIRGQSKKVRSQIKQFAPGLECPRGLSGNFWHQCNGFDSHCGHQNSEEKTTESFSVSEIAHLNADWKAVLAEFFGYIDPGNFLFFNECPNRHLQPGMISYIHGGDECWRRNVLMTSLRFWWHVWSSTSGIS